MKAQIAVATVVATGLAVLAASPAVAASEPISSLKSLGQQFDLAAHRLEIALRGKPVEIIDGDTTTYIAPNGERKITVTGPDDASSVTVCRAPNSRGVMECFMNSDGLWTQVTRMDAPHKGWLGFVGGSMAAVGDRQAGLARDADEQGGSWSASRNRVGHLTRIVTFAVTPGLPAHRQSMAVAFGPRSMKVTERFDGGAPTTVGSIKVVKPRAITFPGDTEVTPGWG